MPKDSETSFTHAWYHFGELIASRSLKIAPLLLPFNKAALYAKRFLLQSRQFKKMYGNLGEKAYFRGGIIFGNLRYFTYQVMVSSKSLKC